MDWSSETAVAIILGARDFTKAGLEDEVAFEKSARAFIDYLGRTDGLALPIANILDLFDAPDGPDTIDQAIEEFICARQGSLRSNGKKLSDVIIYYTGHGVSPTEDYALALKATRKTNIGSSAYQLRHLATTLKQNARDARYIGILDCCFAAAAYEAFESTALDVLVAQATNAFPTTGSALLCAAAPQLPASSRLQSGASESGMTLFSECLLKILGDGVAGVEQQRISLIDVGAALEKLMALRYERNVARPMVKSPSERHGNIARIPMFPNPAFTPRQTIAEIAACNVEALNVVVEPALSLAATVSEISAEESDGREINARLAVRSQRSNLLHIIVGFVIAATGIVVAVALWPSGTSAPLDGGVADEGNPTHASHTDASAPRAIAGAIYLRGNGYLPNLQISIPVGCQTTTDETGSFEFKPCPKASDVRNLVANVKLPGCPMPVEFSIVQPPNRTLAVFEKCVVSNVAPQSIPQWPKEIACDPPCEGSEVCVLGLCGREVPVGGAEFVPPTPRNTGLVKLWGVRNVAMSKARHLIDNHCKRQADPRESPTYLVTSKGLDNPIRFRCGTQFRMRDL